MKLETNQTRTRWSYDLRTKLCGLWPTSAHMPHASVMLCISWLAGWSLARMYVIGESSEFRETLKIQLRTNGARSRYVQRTNVHPSAHLARSGGDRWDRYERMRGWELGLPMPSCQLPGAQLSKLRSMRRAASFSTWALGHAETKFEGKRRGVNSEVVVPPPAFNSSNRHTPMFHFIRGGPQRTREKLAFGWPWLAWLGA